MIKTSAKTMECHGGLALQTKRKKANGCLTILKRMSSFLHGMKVNQTTGEAKFQEKTVSLLILDFLLERILLIGLMLVVELEVFQLVMLRAYLSIHCVNSIHRKR